MNKIGFQIARNTSIHARFAFASKFRELIELQQNIVRLEGRVWQIKDEEVKSSNTVVGTAAIYHELDRLRQRRDEVLQDMKDQESINIKVEKEVRNNGNNDFWKGAA